MASSFLFKFTKSDYRISYRTSFQQLEKCLKDLKGTIILKDQIHLFTKLSEFSQSVINDYPLSPEEKATLITQANALISRKAANFAYSAFGRFNLPIEKLKLDLSSIDSITNLKELIRYFPYAPGVMEAALRKSRLLNKDDLAYCIKNYPDIRDQIIEIYLNKMRVKFETFEGLGPLIELISKNEITHPRVIQDVKDASVYLTLSEKDPDMHSIIRIYESLAFGWNKVFEVLPIYSNLVSTHIMSMHPADLSYSLKVFVYMNSLKRIPYLAYQRINTICRTLRDRGIDINNLIPISKSLYQLGIQIPEETYTYIKSSLIQSEENFNLEQIVGIIELICIIQAKRAILPKYTYKLIYQLMKDDSNLLVYSELYTITKEYDVLKEIQPILKHRIIQSLPCDNIHELIGTMLVCLFPECRDILSLVESNLMSLLDTEIPVEAYGKLLNMMGKLEYENAKFSSDLIFKLTQKILSLDSNSFDSIIVFSLHYFTNKRISHDLVRRSIERIKQNHQGIEVVDNKPNLYEFADWYKEGDKYIVIKNDFMNRLGIRGQATILISIFLMKSKDIELIEISRHYIKKIARHHFFEIKLKHRITLIKGAAFRDNLDKQILTELIIAWNKYPLPSLQILDRWKTLKDFTQAQSLLRNSNLKGLPELELNVMSDD
jgi:hypothetical protein